MSDGKIPAREICKCGHSASRHSIRNSRCLGSDMKCKCTEYRWSGNKTMNIWKFKKGNEQ